MGTSTDSDTRRALTDLRAELAREFKAVNKRLERIEKEGKRQGKKQNQLWDAIAWQALINDLILCGVCLVVSFGIKGVDHVKTEVCPQLPRWAVAAVPFNFCGGTSSDGVTANAATPEEAKVKAFLDTIAWAEGTGESYNVMFTHAPFEGDRHPRQIQCSGDLCSDAAGRYQFLSTTWDGLGLPNFSPENQDKGAIALLKQSGAYQQILSGDIEGALCTAGTTWASLPCNTYGQPQKATAELMAKYQQFLEKYATSGNTATAKGWINPVPKGTFTSGFGYRVHPLRQFTTCHMGIDLAAPTGTPILAAKSGTVATAGDAGDGFGYKVVLQHPDGSRSLYAHASKLLVREGQQVNQGDAIALVGSTGNSTGPHLHFEVTDTQRRIIDPLPLLPAPPNGAQTFGTIDSEASKECMGRSL